MKLEFLGTGAADWNLQRDQHMEGFRRLSSALLDDKLLLDPGPHVFHYMETYQKPDLLDHLDRHYRAELETAQCLTGPHKDDFTVSLSGIDLKAYGSQGQTRTAAISLKLAQRELMGREWGEEPVLLLDDVLSELDPGRQDFVLNQISQGQVFITCCEPGQFSKLGKTIQVEQGRIREEI